MVKTPGKLILAANSLGRSEDIPARTLAALRGADLVIFEEARPARQALKAAGVHREFLLLSEHDQPATIAAAQAVLAAGQTIVYMSDQGMPNLADPGRRLVEIAFAGGAQLQVIPGASSVTAALAACPFWHDEFVFRGFLPRDGAERQAALEKLRSDKRPVVIMDTPYRLLQVLQACSDVFGTKRPMLLAVDISGPQENYFLGTARSIIGSAEKFSEKLNFVLVVAGE